MFPSRRPHRFLTLPVPLLSYVAPNLKIIDRRDPPDTVPYAPLQINNRVTITFCIPYSPLPVTYNSLTPRLTSSLYAPTSHSRTASLLLLLSTARCVIDLLLDWTPYTQLPHVCVVWTIQILLQPPTASYSLLQDSMTRIMYGSHKHVV